MMLSMLYPLSFLAAVLSLSLWFYYQQNTGVSRLLRTVFFAALTAYIVSLVLQPGPINAKWTLLGRDIAILAAAPALLSIFRNRAALFFPLLAAVALMMAFGWNRFTPKQAEGDWELLVELKEGRDLKDLKKISRKYGLHYEQAFYPKRPHDTDLDNYYLVEIPRSKEHKIDAISRKFLGHAAVEWVEANDRVQIEKRGNYKLNDPGLDKLWSFEQMDMEALYQLIRERKLRPEKKALVAILDTGIDARHEDLKGAFKSLQSAHDKDPHGHGTHCAGIAAAVSNNGVGIASFSPDNALYSVTSVRVLNANGSGTQAGIMRGIIEAADGGADVISLSLGGRSNDSKQTAYKKVVKYANDAGAIVVVAAGNNGADARDIAPANAPGVIAVSAVDSTLQRAPFSNSVAGIEMGIAAPGVDIYSTLPGDKYNSMSGTSMATPYVGGLVGAMKALKPSLTTQEAYEILSKTGVSSGSPSETGAFIQPEKAIRALLGL